MWLELNAPDAAAKISVNMSLARSMVRLRTGGARIYFDKEHHVEVAEVPERIVVLMTSLRAPTQEA